MKKGVIIAAATAVVVLGGGGSFAYAAQLFSSPKQILVNAMQKASSQSPRDAELSFKASLTGLTLTSQVPISPQILSQLSNSSLSGDIKFAPDQKEVASQLTFKPSSGDNYTLKAWVTSDRAIISASSLQSLLSQIAQTEGAPSSSIPKIPEYLTSNSSMSGQITNFWSQLNAQKTDPAKAKAARDLLVMFVQGIPSKYINRNGLSGLELKITQSNFKDVVDSEVSYFYDHKTQLIQDFNTMEAGTGRSLNANDLFRGQTKSQVIQNINNALEVNPLNVNKINLNISKGLFGGPVTASYDASISFNPANANGMSGTLNVSYTAKSEKHVSIQVPSTDSHNSETFQNFFSRP